MKVTTLALVFALACACGAPAVRSPSLDDELYRAAQTCDLETLWSVDSQARGDAWRYPADKKRRRLEQMRRRLAWRAIEWCELLKL